MTSQDGHRPVDVPCSSPECSEHNVRYILLCVIPWVGNFPERKSRVFNMISHTLRFVAVAENSMFSWVATSHSFRVIPPPFRRKFSTPTREFEEYKSSKNDTTTLRRWRLRRSSETSVFCYCYPEYFNIYSGITFWWRNNIRKRWKAELSARYLRHVPFCKVYSSTMKMEARFCSGWFSTIKKSSIATDSSLD
jgi:hypothetical protein